MYVAFEGIDGVGKSTQIELLKSYFQEAIFTHEPGASELGIHLRKLLLEKKVKLSLKAELLLFLADRAQHFEELLKFHSNKLIISDRSVISGMAYAFENFDFQTLFWLNNFVLEACFPQKIIFLQADEKLFKQRLDLKKLDKIEQRGNAYLMKIQENFKIILEKLKKEKKIKIFILDANEDKFKLHEKIKGFIND